MCFEGENNLKSGFLATKSTFRDDKNGDQLRKKKDKKVLNDGFWLKKSVK